MYALCMALCGANGWIERQRERETERGAMCTLYMYNVCTVPASLLSHRGVQSSQRPTVILAWTWPPLHSEWTHMQLLFKLTTTHIQYMYYNNTMYMYMYMYCKFLELMYIHVHVYVHCTLELLSS